MAVLPSLQVLILRHFADSIIDEFLTIQSQYIAEKIDLDEVVLRSRAVSSHWEVEIFPEDLKSALQSYIYEYASDIAFLFAIARGDALQSFEVNSPSSTMFRPFPLQATIAPQPIIECFLENLSTNLTTLKLHGAYLNDARFASLTDSVAAKNIQVLSLDRPFISDVSASLWLKFESLQELELIEALWMTLVSFKSICKLQNLRKVDIFSPSDVKIADYLCFFELDSAPALTDFKVDNASALSLATEAQLRGLLKGRTNRENIRSVELGQLPYNPECAEMFDLCPNLERNPYFFTSLEHIESTGAPEAMTHLQIRTLAGGLTDAGLRRLHELCPNLISLSLRDSEIKLQIESLNIFSGLKELKFTETLGIDKLTSYPSTLMNLTFDRCLSPYTPGQDMLEIDEPSSEASQRLSAEEWTTQMLNNIIRDSPNLKTFYTFETFQLTTQHVEMLYSGLVQATDIETSFPPDPLDFGASSFVCSSPSVERFKLDRWGDIYKGRIPRFSNLPALKELSLIPLLQTKNENDRFVVELSNQSLPRLRCLELGYIESEVLPSDLRDQFSGITSLHRSLRHLSLYGDWNAFFNDSDPFSRLDRLQSFHLRGFYAFMCYPSMSNLLYLEISCGVMPRWIDPKIRFPHLHHLKFDDVSIVGTISITAQQFPSLEIFQAIRIARSGIEIRDHPKLFSVILNSFNHLPRIEIVRCAKLFQISICDILASCPILVDENVKLSRLNLYRCKALSHPETKFQVSPVDYIKVITSDNEICATELFKKIVLCSEAAGRLLSAVCTIVRPGGNVDIFNSEVVI